MSGWLGLIVALMYLVIHVASILAKEAAKRKEQQRKLEQAERRRMAEARLEIPGPATEATSVQPQAWQRPGAPRPPAPPPPTGNRPVDDPRRKQQLEQLRNHPFPQPQQSQQRVPGRASAQPQPVAMPQQRGPDIERERRRREASSRSAEQRANHQRAAVAKVKQLQQAKLDAEQHRRAELHTMATTSEAPHLHAAPITHYTPPSAIMAKLKNRQTLREVFILRELIDPPVALRQHPI